MKEQFNSVITPTEYSELIKLENPTPVEQMQMKRYEEYIKDCDYLDDLMLLPTSAQDIYTKHNNNMLNLSSKEVLSKKEQSVLSESQNNREKQEVNGKTRVLAKDGYIDVIVIIAVVLNIGFIVALTMLTK